MNNIQASPQINEQVNPTGSISKRNNTIDLFAENISKAAKLLIKPDKGLTHSFLSGLKTFCLISSPRSYTRDIAREICEHGEYRKIQVNKIRRDIVDLEKQLKELDNQYQKVIQENSAKNPLKQLVTPFTEFTSKEYVKNKYLETQDKLLKKQLELINSELLFVENMLGSHRKEGALDKLLNHKRNLEEIILNPEKKKVKYTDQKKADIENLLRAIPNLESGREILSRKKENLENFFHNREMAAQKWGLTPETVSTLFSIYCKFHTDPKQTLQLLMQSFEQIQSYALKNPCEEMKQVIYDMHTFSNMLLGKTELGSIARQLQMESLSEAIMQGFSTAHLPKHPKEPMSEEMKLMCKVIHELPTIYSLTAESHSMLPLRTVGAALTTLDLPQAGAFFTFSSLLLGAYEKYLRTKCITEVKDILTEGQRRKLNNILQFMQTEYTTMEELEKAKDTLRLATTTMQIANGKEKTKSIMGIFKYASRGIKDFCLKIYLAKTWSEKITRVAISVGIPLAVFSTTVIAIAAALVALPPLGIAIIAAVVAAIALFAADTYGSYILSKKLTHFLDDYYLETTNALEEYKQRKADKKKQKQIDRAILANQAKMSEIIKLCQNHFDEMYALGFYQHEIEQRLESEETKADRELSVNKKRKIEHQFIQEKHIKIARQVEELAKRQLNGDISLAQAKEPTFTDQLENLKKPGFFHEAIFSTEKDYFRTSQLINRVKEKLPDEEDVALLEEHEDSLAIALRKTMTKMALNKLD